MLKHLYLILTVLFLGSFFVACKPVRKSYLPYKKRNKCGCPTYGMEKQPNESEPNSALKNKNYFSI